MAFIPEYDRPELPGKDAPEELALGEDFFPGVQGGTLTVVEGPVASVGGFYWYSIRAPTGLPFSDSMVERRQPDGALVWDTYDYDNEELAEPFWDIYAWPGFPYLSSTRRGVFVQETGNDPVLSGFFLISPDGSAVGGRVLGVNSPNNWGQEVVEDNEGDHYAIYQNSDDLDSGSTNVVLAGWNGIDTIKWSWTTAEMFALGELVAAEGEAWVNPARLAISRDGSVLAVLWTNGTIMFHRTDTGAFINAVTPYSVRYTWEGYFSLERGSDGSLFAAVVEEKPSSETLYFHVSHVVKFAWEGSGWASTPEWDVPMTEDTLANYGEVFAVGMATTSDGGVAVLTNYYLGLGQPFPDNDHDLRKWNADGSLAWTRLSGPTAYVDTAYARILHVGGSIFYSSQDDVSELVRVDASTGEDLAWAEPPLEHDWMHIGLAPIWETGTAYEEGVENKTARDVFPNNAPRAALAGGQDKFTALEWLANDDGALWLNDDGTESLPA